VEPEPFPDDVREYLQLHHIVTLGTSSFTGIPHADTVVFTNDQWRLYFTAAEGSSLLKNVKANRYASFTIDDYTTDWRKVRELQGVGRCEPANPDEEHWAYQMAFEKFGSKPFDTSAGIILKVVPGEMHFVDYDYATVAAKSTVTERVFRLTGNDAVPTRGPVSTSLDRSTFEAGQIIFRPGDRVGQYYVVLEGEVEIRGEGFGADQTVVRVGPGEFFGDHASLRGQRGVLTAHAVKPTVLLAVERETIRDLLLP